MLRVKLKGDKISDLYSCSNEIVNGENFSGM